MRPALIIFFLFILVSNNACAQLLYQRLNVKTLKLPSESVSSALYLNASNQIKSHASVSDTELGYLDGVTSAIQTQIGTKQATLTGAATTIASSDLTVSRAVVSNGSGKIAVATTTAAEIDFVNGVTSAIQTQLNAKIDTAGVTKPVVYSFVVGPTGTVSNERGDAVNGNCTNANPRVCTFNSIWTGSPNCTASVSDASFRLGSISAVSSSSISVDAFIPNTGATSGTSVAVVCHGAGI